MSINIEENDLAKLLNLSFNDVQMQMREYANANDVPIIQDEGLAFLETIIRLKRVKSILEIGTAIGYSASALQAVSNGNVWTIERDPKMYEEAKKNVSRLGLEDKINIIFKDALEAYDDVCKQKFDMIFIDAAKGQYQNFFNLYEPLLAPDGIIVCDNMLFHGLLNDDVVIESRSLRGLVRKIKNYHDFILNNDKYDTKIFNIGDGISVSTKKVMNK